MLPQGGEATENITFGILLDLGPIFTQIFNRFRLHFGTLIWTPNLATGFKEGQKTIPERPRSGPWRRRAVQERPGPLSRAIWG